VRKYEPLFRYLCEAGDGPVEMTFEEIGRLVGGLPTSARRHPGWWSNEPVAGPHVQAEAWREAGREVIDVDLAGGQVRFSAARWLRGS